MLKAFLVAHCQHCDHVCTRGDAVIRAFGREQLKGLDIEVGPGERLFDVVRQEDGTYQAQLDDGTDDAEVRRLTFSDPLALQLLVMATVPHPVETWRYKLEKGPQSFRLSFVKDLSDECHQENLGKGLAELPGVTGATVDRYAIVVTVGSLFSIDQVADAVIQWLSSTLGHPFAAVPADPPAAQAVAGQPAEAIAAK